MPAGCDAVHNGLLLGQAFKWTTLHQCSLAHYHEADPCCLWSVEIMYCIRFNFTHCILSKTVLYYFMHHPCFTWMVHVQVWKPCITLTWSNPPSVSYYGIFPVMRQICSTIQDSFTKLQLAYIQRSKIRILSVVLSVEFANANTAQKVQYRPDTDNHANNQCITKCVCVNSKHSH